MNYQKADDVLFAPVAMSQGDKDFLWEIIVTALGATFDEDTMSDLKKQFDHEVDQVGYIEIINKANIREAIDEI